jgi:hypothetical protein
MSDFVKTAIESMRSHSPTPPTPKEYDFLFARIKREAELARQQARRQAHARAWELAKKQGVKPIRSIEDLQGDFWPEEESVDDFLDWVRTIRQQDKPRSELE